MTTDRSTITCVEPDCGRTFSLTPGEIDFYVQRDFDLPKRCKTCRTARKNGKAAIPKTAPKVVAPSVEPSIIEITCDNCGRESTVPFRPIPNKSVYCKLCWEGIKNVVTIPDLGTYN